MRTWIDIKGIMLNKIRHTEKDKYWMISLICRIQKTKQIKKKTKTKLKQNHRYRE